MTERDELLAQGRDLFRRKSQRKRRALADQISRDLDNPPPTIATGLPRLDDLLAGGFRPGEMCVVAARPGVGKSAFALQVAMETVRSGRPVCIWTLEMSEKAWTNRLLAGLSGINPKRLRIGGSALTAEECRKLADAVGVWDALPLSFAEGPSDPDGFADEAEMQVRFGEVALIIVDYVQLMDTPPGKAFSRENQVAQLSRAIKKTALELEIPIMALGQLNRNAENKIPTLADLRESGALEADADEVFFLHRDRDPETMKHRDRGLGILAKNRDGETGAICLRYNWRAFRFDQDGFLAVGAA